MTTVYDFLPQQLLSRAVGALARSEQAWLKNAFIKMFCKQYQVDLSEAIIQDPMAFASFNEFFTRELRPGLRPISPSAQAFVSPADGQLVASGIIKDHTLIQAKGRYYSLKQLLGDDAWVQRFENSAYSTVYLAPKDYHRVHMPMKGALQAMRYVPGSLYPVNNQSALSVDRLFSRNERVICYFQTEQGPLAVIFVGALLVGQMSTVWMPKLNEVRPSKVQNWHYDGQQQFEKGEEIGHFSMGSTVITLLPTGQLDWKLDASQQAVPVRMGETIAEFLGDD